MQIVLSEEKVSDIAFATIFKFENIKYYDAFAIPVIIKNCPDVKFIDCDIKFNHNIYFPAAPIHIYNGCDNEHLLNDLKSFESLFDNNADVDCWSFKFEYKGKRYTLDGIETYIPISISALDYDDINISELSDLLEYINNEYFKYESKHTRLLNTIKSSELCEYSFKGLEEFDYADEKCGRYIPYLLSQNKDIQINWIVTQGALGYGYIDTIIAETAEEQADLFSNFPHFIVANMHYHTAFWFMNITYKGEAFDISSDVDIPDMEVTSSLGKDIVEYIETELPKYIKQAQSILEVGV
jgi:hypothetical protein